MTEPTGYGIRQPLLQKEREGGLRLGEKPKGEYRKQGVVLQIDAQAQEDRHRKKNSAREAD